MQQTRSFPPLGRGSNLCRGSNLGPADSLNADGLDRHPVDNQQLDSGGSEERVPKHSLHRLLSIDRTRARVSAGSRKRALEHGCEILAGCNDLDARSVLDALLARERLGSTALGDGVAIPHCRLEDCKAPVGVLLTLAKPVDCNAPDDRHVDLLFILVVPESAADEHLQILSQLAGILIKEENRQALRQARDHLTLFETMIGLS